MEHGSVAELVDSKGGEADGSTWRGGGERLSETRATMPLVRMSTDFTAVIIHDIVLRGSFRVSLYTSAKAGIPTCAPQHAGAFIKGGSGRVKIRPHAQVRAVGTLAKMAVRQV